MSETWKPISRLADCDNGLSIAIVEIQNGEQDTVTVDLISDDSTPTPRIITKTGQSIPVGDEFVRAYQAMKLQDVVAKSIKDDE